MKLNICDYRETLNRFYGAGLLETEVSVEKTTNVDEAMIPDKIE
ncbi:hypothetical protein RGU12_12860 [Fredinandcohnia sp. QZ13]|nr:hypothetical protein [Fredinandcohnia sp. QZ13]MDR4888413.1 hypothetical protein [Fredinandcohnia sp. QZ13]